MCTLTLNWSALPHAGQSCLEVPCLLTCKFKLFNTIEGFFSDKKYVSWLYSLHLIMALCFNNNEKSLSLTCKTRCDLFYGLNKNMWSCINSICVWTSSNQHFSKKMLRGKMQHCYICREINATDLYRHMFTMHIYSLLYYSPSYSEFIKK